MIVSYSDIQVWTNSVEPEQTEGAVWSGYTLFVILSASFRQLL